MANNCEVLLKLVRMAMGWETDFSLPNDVNWPEVLQMAFEQGVSAIIIDGYDILCQNNPNPKGGLTSLENKGLLLEAIGQSQMIESTYRQHLEALKEVSNIIGEIGVPFMLMKGFACGQYYPNPRHRACGDIDIYPGDQYDKSNEAFAAAGIGVDPYYYRHSASFVKGVMVENHRVLCDLRGPKHQTRALERQLEDEANKSIRDGKVVVVDNISIEGAKYPIADFNALFLPWHVSAHFLIERVTVRHLLDWALFLTHEGKDINVEKFREAKREYTYGYSKMADILTNLSLRYLGMPVDGIPKDIIDDALGFDNDLADKVFNYMFEGELKERDSRLWKERLNNVKRIWQERWKYQEIYGMNALEFLLMKVKGVVFKEGE